MRKRKKEKYNNFLFILFIIILGILIYLYKTNNYNNPFYIEIPIEEEEQKTKEETKKNDPYKEYKKCNNYKNENLNRYLKYKESNHNLAIDKVVTYVNIGLDYKYYSYISDADTSKNILLLVNKYLKLSSDYEPSDLVAIDSKYFINGNTYVRKLRKEAQEAFEMMCSKAQADGYTIYGQSAYRPYSMQTNLYNSAIKSMGKDAADNDTARPGHSEHQTGLAIDVSSTKGGNMLYFHKTSSYKWMNENAYKYGFILRYTKGYENIHGFVYESWHYRYVGVKVATDMHDNYPDMTYDEYYYNFID